MSVRDFLRQIVQRVVMQAGLGKSKVRQCGESRRTAAKRGENSPRRSNEPGVQLDRTIIVRSQGQEVAVGDPVYRSTRADS